MTPERLRLRLRRDRAVEQEDRARADAERLLDVVIRKENGDPALREVMEEVAEAARPLRVDAGERLVAHQHTRCARDGARLNPDCKATCETRALDRETAVPGRGLSGISAGWRDPGRRQPQLRLRASHPSRRQPRARRDAWLQSQGFRVLRFWNAEVEDAPDYIVASILKAANRDGG